MKRRHFLLLLPALAALPACQSMPEQAAASSAGMSQHAMPFEEAEPRSVRQQMTRLRQTVATRWGDTRISTPHRIVKYTEHYRARAHIDFRNGEVTVESLTDRETLRRAIVSTLLLPADPQQVDLFSARPPARVSEEPFLYGLVLDQNEEPVATRAQAEAFADWLLRHAYERNERDARIVHQVRFPMSERFKGHQQERYAPHVERCCADYDLDPSLVWAIIDVETSFNPFGISSVPAFGLMQVVPETAGRDVWQHQPGTDRIPQPTPATLMSPAQGIFYGTTYLHLLDSRYLSAIDNLYSREICMIAAYNAGAGEVLRTFHPDRSRAAALINRMAPEQVFAYLMEQLRSAEARRYLQLVHERRTLYMG